MENNNRLLGIDLCRGIAAFAVVLVHSGDSTWEGYPSQAAKSFRLLFYFAVPFFTATSFYFSAIKIERSTTLNFLKTKLSRILVPYIIWSAIYVLLRTSFFWFTGQEMRLSKYLDDPFAIIFCGGASYQLYFLPLILSGTTLFLFIRYFNKNIFRLRILVLMAAFSIFCNQLLIISGNNFHLGQYIAFKSITSVMSINVNNYAILRIFLVYISWILGCLPYLFTAFILKNIFHDRGHKYFFKKKFLIIFLLIFLIADTLGLLGLRVLPRPFKNFILAYSFFFIGVSISDFFDNKNYLIQSLGKCSFGIYLVHPIVMNLCKPFLQTIYPGIFDNVTIISMLTIAILSFIGSWLVVFLISRRNWCAKYILGI